jgi:cytochrome c2
VCDATGDAISTTARLIKIQAALNLYVLHLTNTVCDMIKKNLLLSLLPVLVLTFIVSCNTGNAFDDNSIAKDSVSIAAGEALFNKNCEGCHNFRQDGIGPQLSAITTKLSTEWLTNFIKDPQKIISSGDEHAKTLYAKYKIAMPSFATLKDDEIKHIISFLNTNTDTSKIVKDDNNDIKDPIPAKIQKSNLVAGLQLIAQIPASSDSGKTPLARITQMIVQPTTHKLFVLDLRGKLYQLQQGKPQLYMDMQKLEPNFINEPGLATGFGSIAFHPDFMKKWFDVYNAYRASRLCKSRFCIQRFYKSHSAVGAHRMEG